MTDMILQATAVAIGGRALLIEGAPGSGKSTLALALIDRGAQLIGDDGVTLTSDGDQVIASPPPNICGKLEIRNVGILDFAVTSAPLALVLSIDDAAPRHVEHAQTRDILGCTIPAIAFTLGGIAPVVRAEWALRAHGLAIPRRQEEYGRKVTQEGNPQS